MFLESTIKERKQKKFYLKYTVWYLLEQIVFSNGTSVINYQPI
jgi:hypothetical protein